MSVSVVIVDDEPLARRKLSSMLSRVTWARQIGEARDGIEAIDAVARGRPDILLLDIEMPELSGIQVLERLRALEAPPAVVLTTAYDRYAVAAFELAAVDYLIKPFAEERFLVALERARKAVETRDGAAVLERALSIVAGARSANRLEHLFVRDRKGVLPIAVRDIHRIEAQDDYVLIHAHIRPYLMSLRIGDLEERLPNPPFLRVHRSHIVNLEYVERMVECEGSRLEVRMRDGTQLPVSRMRSRSIRRLAR